MGCTDRRHTSTVEVNQMTVRTDMLEPLASMDRREFTLNAALAILAGCVITISDTACGSSSPAAPTAAPTAVPAAPADITGDVSANHGHIAVITGASITAGTAYSLDIHGTATHTHTLSISQQNLASLKSKQPVTMTSTTDASHSHTVTFTPV
jgi:hypothetical protein